MSFTGLLASEDGRPAATVRNGLGDRVSARTGHGVPKFKSLPPPSLPISPPAAAAATAFSPSSFFALPPGLSPSELLDSPVLLSGSNLLPSPTTGTFPIESSSWNNNMSSGRSQQKDIKDEQNNFPEFSFQTQTNPLTSYPWGYLESLDPELASSDKPNFEPELSSVQSFSPEISTIQTIDPKIIEHNQSSQDNRKSEDGYNWRKYGQKQVKGSENPRSYYKCTYPNCPTKKKLERSLDGKITEIVIRGTHNHPKPQSTRRSSSSSPSASSVVFLSCSAQSNEMSQGSNVVGRTDHFLGTPENSSLSNDDLEQSIQRSLSGCDEVDEDGPNFKRWKGENGSEGISGMESRTVREPRVVVQTMSDVDILDDGYRWRKYGQKVVKGNPNPRSYYKCTNHGCQVRKHVERAAQDSRAVITTYEGKHNHDVPPGRSRNSSNAVVVRPMPRLLDSDIPTTGYENSRSENFTSSLAIPLLEYGEARLPRAKDEPVDDVFADSFLC
ncbi:Probable WRKY transcription factor 26 [Striga hermonthica]|uniref:Probable WRKY transcription factor 26 n=1 Tax=Striga hermonthica TaxID=68872 RepID=A0A9N7RTY2_STRHE|nr:Probable WRKY transcription factor 26 [Striga hermonthica]